MRHGLVAASKTSDAPPKPTPGLGLMIDLGDRLTVDCYNKLGIGLGDTPVGGSTSIDKGEVERGRNCVHNPGTRREHKRALGKRHRDDRKLKAIKASIAKTTGASALLNVIF